MKVHASLLTLVAILGLGSSGAPAQQGSRSFSVAELFVELNDTDGDLGLHASIDGGTWISLDVEGPGDRDLLDIVSTGRLRRQGLTQLAFESQEPSFDELPPDAFFARFPEGSYEIEALAPDGSTLRSRVRLSHVLAAPPEATVNGQPAAESCDAPVLPHVLDPVVIDWDPVTESHPDIGRKGPVSISRYQFFVERGDTKLSVDLPKDVTEFEVPAAITVPGSVLKYEIIARTSTGNNTAIESCFRMF